MRYELGFYIPEDDILRNHRRENVKSYKSLEYTLPTEDAFQANSPKHTSSYHLVAGGCSDG
jgi:hypothetical protein